MTADAGTAGFRRIVVGYDGSDAAGAALAFAQRVAAPEDATLVVVHVDDTRGFRRYRRGGAQKRDVLAGVATRVETRAAVEPVEVSSSSVARGLTELAEERAADLVVLGAHRGAGPGRTACGPVAHRMLQGGPCAVAVTPRDWAGDARFHHLGVAFDASPESLAALRAAYALAARDGAAVTIVMVLPPRPPDLFAGSDRDFEAAAQQRRMRAQEQLDAAADAAPPGVNPRALLIHGETVPELARATDGIVDALFAGSRGYGPVHRVLAGSVTESLLAIARHPVVLLPRAPAGQSAVSTEGERAAFPDGTPPARA